MSIWNVLLPSFQLSDDQAMDEDTYREKRFEFGIPEGPNELAGELPVFMNADIMNGIRSVNTVFFSWKVCTYVFF